MSFRRARGSLYYQNNGWALTVLPTVNEMHDNNAHVHSYTPDQSIASPALDGFVQIHAGQISPRAVTTEQAAVLADLALTVLQKPRGVSDIRIAAIATILSGRMTDLEPHDFRDVMIALVKSAAASSLDVIGGFYGLTRGTTVHAGGQFPEADLSFSERVLLEALRPALSSDDDRLVGVSLRTVLYFRPQATLTQQEAAIEKTIKAVKAEIVRTEVDQTFRINEMWVVVRFTCQGVVIDAGEPNKPFEELLLWRGGKPEPLLGNYTVKPGERLVVEPSLPSAIDIRPAGRPSVLSSRFEFYLTVAERLLTGPGPGSAERNNQHEER